MAISIDVIEKRVNGVENVETITVTITLEEYRLLVRDNERNFAKICQQEDTINQLKSALECYRTEKGR